MCAVELQPMGLQGLIGLGVCGQNHYVARVPRAMMTMCAVMQGEREQVSGINHKSSIAAL